MSRPTSSSTTSCTSPTWWPCPSRSTSSHFSSSSRASCPSTSRSRSTARLLVAKASSTRTPTCHNVTRTPTGFEDFDDCDELEHSTWSTRSRTCSPASTRREYRLFSVNAYVVLQENNALAIPHRTLRSSSPSPGRSAALHPVQHLEQRRAAVLRLLRRLDPFAALAVRAPRKMQQRKDVAGADPSVCSDYPSRKMSILRTETMRFCSQLVYLPYIRP